MALTYPEHNSSVDSRGTGKTKSTQRWGEGDGTESVSLKEKIQQMTVVTLGWTPEGRRKRGRPISDMQKGHLIFSSSRLTGVLLLLIKTLSRSLKSWILVCLSNLSLDFSWVFRISWAVFKFWIIKCSSNLDVFGSLWDCLHQKEDSFLSLKACRMVTNRLTELENFVVMRFLGSLEGQFALCHLMVKDS